MIVGARAGEAGAARLAAATFVMPQENRIVEPIPVPLTGAAGVAAVGAAVFLAVVAGVAAVVYAGVVAAGSVWAGATVPHQSCPARGTLVQVDTAARTLSLCRAGREEASFRVALGRGGVDKRAEGDGRTPRGRYALGQARASARYNLFIPVGYPTREQAERGFNGGAIGVHGPHAAFAWLGAATAWPDWTQGCIALGKRADAAHVADWVRRSGAREIVIR